MSESSSSESSYGGSSESSYSYSNKSSRRSYNNPYDDDNYNSYVADTPKPVVPPAPLNTHVVSLSKAHDSFKTSLEKGATPVTELTEEEKKKARSEITKIKKKLKVIEDSVIENFSLEEKQGFVKTFREIIMNNEEQVMQFPNASFFIAKFEQSDKSVLNENFKAKILKKLNELHELEKQKNSKLKYW